MEKILEKQWQEMQQLLLQLKEVARLHWAEYAVQKTRREVEEKAQKKAERQRIVEEEKKKKRTLEYLQ